VRDVLCDPRFAAPAARVRKLATFRADPGECLRALASGAPWDAYVALCAGGMRDVLATIPEARALIRDLSPDVRAAARCYAAATTTRTHKTLIWERTRCTHRLRHALRDYLPGRAGDVRGPRHAGHPGADGADRHAAAGCHSAKEQPNCVTRM